MTTLIATRSAIDLSFGHSSAWAAVLAWLFAGLPFPVSAQDLTLEGWWKYGQSEAGAIDFEEQHFYLGSGAMLRVYDISSDELKLMPRWLSDVAVDGFVNRMAIDANTLYIATSESENVFRDATVVVFDISDRARPKRVNTFEGVAEISSIYVNGRTTFLGRSTHGITAVRDIADPLNATDLGTYKVVGEEYDRLAGSGNLLYALNTYDGKVYVLDATTPGNLQFRSEIPIAPSTFDVAAWSHYLFVVVKDTGYPATPPWLVGGGVVVFDTADPTAPVRRHVLEGYDPPYKWGWQAICVNYPKLFVGYSSAGVGVFDLSVMTEATPPARLAKYFPGKTMYIREFAATKDFLYAMSIYGAMIYDTRAPSSSPIMKEIREFARTFQPVSTGNQFVFTLGDEWLHLFDVTASPLEPLYVEAIGGRIREIPRVWTKSGRAYLATGSGWGGFGIYDITDPFEFKLGFRNDAMNLIDLAYSPAQEMLFVASQISYGTYIEHFIRSFDVSNASNPVQIEQLKTGQTLSGIEGYTLFKVIRCHGDYLYVLFSENAGQPMLAKLVIYKIGPDKKLGFVKEVDFGLGNISMFEFEGDYGYIDTDASFHVLDMTSPENPQVIGTNTSVKYATNILPDGASVFVAGMNTTTATRDVIWIDVSDKLHPTTRSVFHQKSAGVFGLSRNLDKLVVATGEVGVMTLAIPSNSPMPNPTLRFKDPVTGSTRYASSATVDAVIGNDETAVAWLLSEAQSTKPAADDPSWGSSRPTSYALGATEGIRTVFLWVKDETANVNSGPIAASIILDRTAPTLQAADPSNCSTVSELKQVLFTFAEDFGLDVTGTQISVTKDGALFTDYAQASSARNGIALTINNPSDGQYRFTFSPRDLAGNVGAATIVALRDAGTLLAISGVASVDDAWLTESLGTNYGDYPWMKIGRGDREPWQRDRAIVVFDLSAIPAGAEVLGAEMILEVGTINYSANLNVHRLLTGWKELEVTWSRASAATGWSTPGGDYGPVIASTAFSETGTVRLGGQGILDTVKDWSTNAETNFGFLLEDDAAAAGFGANLSQSERGGPTPRLEVAYCVGPICNGDPCQCEETLSRCDGLCVDLDADPLHCGDCDTRCDLGRVCVSRACRCDTGFAECGDVCADLTADPRHCGNCDHVCAASMSCSQGQCLCPAGLADCDGTCVDLASDPSHCGRCGNACLVEEECVANACRSARFTTDGCECGSTTGSLALALAIAGLTAWRRRTQPHAPKHLPDGINVRSVSPTRRRSGKEVELA